MMNKNFVARFINFWPPFLGAGIRVKRISKDFREIDVEMPLKFNNKNYVGVHFGGSLFSMTDPFYMMMVLENLGREFVVWDKAASIRYKKPGRSRVRAEFRLSPERLQSIRDEVEAKGKIESKFFIEIKDELGDVVAEVEKTLSIRKK